MNESQHERTPLLRPEDVDKVEVYPIIHMIRKDVIVSPPCLQTRIRYLLWPLALHRCVFELIYQRYHSYRGHKDTPLTYEAVSWLQSPLHLFLNISQAHRSGLDVYTHSSSPRKIQCNSTKWEQICGLLFLGQPCPLLARPRGQHAPPLSLSSRSLRNTCHPYFERLRQQYAGSVFGIDY